MAQDDIYAGLGPAEGFLTDSTEKNLSSGVKEKDHDGDDQVNVLPANLGEIETDKHDMQIGDEELLELEGKLGSMTPERALRIVKQLVQIHKHDQNFPRPVLDRMEQFLNDPHGHGHPAEYPALLREMRLECLLATENSPYVEVRANVDPTDDPTLPVLTVRVWVIGTIFAACGSFIDTLFLYRQPAVYIGANVGQLVAYPVGIFLARVLPDWKFKLFGKQHSLSPGPFNQKEHMLITIMCSVSFTAPYTTYIIPAQALPVFFNQKFAFGRGYQFLNTIGTNFVGYGLAGLTRRFLVYPAVAIWPGSLNTISLIKSFHTRINEPVKGPFGWTYTASREKCFLYAFLAMFCYYFFPGFIFQAMSVFSWMTWIAPNNATLDTVTGFYGGMGLNPWPTFDWNNLTVWLTPLTIPTFAIMNMFVGILVGSIMTLAIFYTNAWNTAYLPINGNSAYDNTGLEYNVSAILTSDNLFDNDLYQQYSQPWMSAGFIISYIWYFALYSATCTYIILFHHHEVSAGYRGFKRSILKTLRKLPQDEQDRDDLSEDVHYRLMKQNYKEVHEWEYLIVLLVSMVIGMVGVGIYPTNTSPIVMLFGIIMPLVCMIPCGLVQAVTGIPVPLNVLAEFIGGALTEGNANGLMYFKTYGYIAVYQALSFSNDLKLALYLKIPPRLTFNAQLWATLIYCLVSASIFNFAMSFNNVCTPEAQFDFYCPGQRTFFTAAVFWGTISPKRLFGAGKRYNMMLLGFPLGVVIVFAYWGIKKMFPRSEWVRQIHPVMIAAGPSTWGSPYNMSYYIGNVYVTWLSFQFIKKRYLGFWAKYNYVIAAAFPAGIAVSAVVIFFALAIPNVSIKWWGNEVVGLGCEGQGGCPRFTDLPDAGYFGPSLGTFT